MFDGINEGWKEFFEERKDQIERVMSLIESKNVEGHQVIPAKKDYFRAWETLSPEEVKVVIVGQDPYHSRDSNGNPIAIGRSFAVSSSCSRIPPSLANIFKEIRGSTGLEPRTDSTLSSWEKQGVFLLNRSLTVLESKPGSHSKFGIWDFIIADTIREIELKAKHKPIFMLWGRESQDIKRFITRAEILESAHPSPLSAKRGFFGCGHFVKANEILASRGQDQIRW